MEVMLNLVDTLVEIGVHKNWQNNRTEEPPSGSIDPLIDFGKDKDKDNKVTTDTKYSFSPSSAIIRKKPLYYIFYPFF